MVGHKYWTNTKQTTNETNNKPLEQEQQIKKEQTPYANDNNKKQQHTNKHLTNQEGKHTYTET